MNEFYKKISDWLLPLDYTEVFSNHPLSLIREFHFAKDGIRVICVHSDDEHCYLHSDILKLPHPLALRTMKFDIGFSELTSVHEYLLTHAKAVKEL